MRGMPAAISYRLGICFEALIPYSWKNLYNISWQAVTTTNQQLTAFLSSLYQFPIKNDLIIFCNRTG